MVIGLRIFKLIYHMGDEKELFLLLDPIKIKKVAFLIDRGIFYHKSP